MLLIYYQLLMYNSKYNKNYNMNKYSSWRETLTFYIGIMPNFYCRKSVKYHAVFKEQ